MPRVKIQPHPHHPDRKCKNCVHWHTGMVQDFVCPAPGQLIVRSEAIKQGMPIATMIETRSAPCIHSPQWQMNDENSYCNQFVRALTQDD